MAQLKNFEDLKSWQKARELANLIYGHTSESPFSKDFELQNQIQRAAGSVMHNIAEGFDAGSNPEFVRFLKIARCSASEVQSQSYLALDRNYITNSDLEDAYEMATEIKKLINGLIRYLQNTMNQPTSH